MKLHQLETIKSRRSRRIGRGGKRGTTAGRGTKGQRSRSGHRIRPAERDLIIRLPKLRGFRNKIKSDKPIVLNLSKLEAKLKTYVKSGALEITRELLVAAGLLSKNFRGDIKILGTGELTFPVTLKNMTASKSASEKISKAK